MRKILILIVCITLAIIFAACEDPPAPTDPSNPSTLESGTTATDATDSTTTPSSKPGENTDPTSGSVPDTKPDPEPTGATKPDATKPDSDPTPPTAPQEGTEPNPEPTGGSEPDPEPTNGSSSNPDPKPNPGDNNKNFLDDFNAAHNTGKKYSFSVDSGKYEISVNTNTGVCTILRKHRVYVENLPLTAELSYYFGKTVCVDYTYYYMGTISAKEDGSVSFRFPGYSMQVKLNDVSASTVKDIRKYAWDNVYKSKWQETWLTKDECELWDDLLDGCIMQDIRRFKDTLEVKGNIHLPLELAYYWHDGHKSQSIMLEKEIATEYIYYSENQYMYRVFTQNGTMLYWGENQPDGSYWREEFDSAGLMLYSIHCQSDGSGWESAFVRENGLLIKTTRHLEVDKSDGLHCTQRTVDVFRFNPKDPADEKWVSSHTYNRHDELVRYFLYNESGQLIESLIADDPGMSTHHVYTYEGKLLAKSVRTNQNGEVTTTEYFYENGELVRRRITIVQPNGDTQQWEENISMDKPQAPT